MEHNCVVAHNAFVDLLQVVVLYEWEGGGREGGRAGGREGGREGEREGGREAERDGREEGEMNVGNGREGELERRMEVSRVQ